jgi:hypothetical protein
VTEDDVPSLVALRSPIRPAAEWLYHLGRQYMPGLRITSVRRTWGEQSRLYARSAQGGCKGPGCSAFPAAPPGHSLHQYGLAWDMARPGVDPFADALLAELGAIWNRIGGRWHASDPIHFEVLPGPGR